MVGQAILRLAKTFAPQWTIKAPTRKELDLTNQEAVKTFFDKNTFDLVIHTAAKVGGIKANSENQATFLSENILINTHVIHESLISGIKNLIYFGSSCMYPRDYKPLLQEQDILAAPLEPSNEGYALAKISGQRLCSYISDQYNVAYKTIIPCNLYGPADNYHPEHSHLMAAIILKIHNALEKQQDMIEIWGTGEVRREFIYVDDLVKFIFSIAGNMSTLPSCLNIGMGQDFTVNQYYEFAAQALGYSGHFVHNLSAPSGMTHKLMDCTRAQQLGWESTTHIEDGIKQAYADFLFNITNDS
jgi:GDP-L-fucose synthase